MTKCNCGAFIAAFNPREVKRWRTNHIHEGRPDPEPDKQGAQGTPREPAGTRTLFECGDCRSLYVAGRAADECCGAWDKGYWD